ncbi:hypothetical protein [Mucilaginibacter sp.]|uniref:hypothetical protein n=1 Tax=Mucilaginibacter sp. TaxID=1882438 RepID=UPI003265CF11
MTTRTRFYLAIAATIVAAVVFIASNFLGYFQAGKQTDFIQGFSGGIAFGAFLGVLTFGTKLRQEKRGQAVQ